MGSKKIRPAWKPLDPKTNQELSDLAIKLKGPMVARRVHSDLFCDDDRAAITEGGLDHLHVVDQWVRLRRVPIPRAILDLAHGIELITDATYRRLLKKIQEQDRRPKTVKHPAWHSSRGELIFDGQVVRTVRGASVATSIRAILDSFQRQGWPDRIDSPRLYANDKQRLRETIATLNRRLSGIRFLSDGSGEGVRWVVV
jgi:hypothetical protein